MNEKLIPAKEIISKELIFLDTDFQKQGQILDYMSHQARQLGYITSSTDFLEAVRVREKELPTAIGHLIAMPHGKTDVVKSPFIAFMRLKEEIDWGNDQCESVRLIFLIGVSTSDSTKLHLKFISQLSKKLLDETFRQDLLSQMSLDGVYQQLTSIKI